MIVIIDSGDDWVCLIVVCYLCIMLYCFFPCIMIMWILIPMFSLCVCLYPMDFQEDVVLEKCYVVPPPMGLVQIRLALKQIWWLNRFAGWTKECRTKWKKRICKKKENTQKNYRGSKPRHSSYIHTKVESFIQINKQHKNFTDMSHTHSPHLYSQYNDLRITLSLSNIACKSLPINQDLYILYKLASLGSYKQNFFYQPTNIT